MPTIKFSASHNRNAKGKITTIGAPRGKLNFRPRHPKEVTLHMLRSCTPTILQDADNEICNYSSPETI